jgi:hypothetical protein
MLILRKFKPWILKESWRNNKKGSSIKKIKKTPIFHRCLQSQENKSFLIKSRLYALG